MLVLQFSNAEIMIPAEKSKHFIRTYGENIQRGKDKMQIFNILSSDTRPLSVSNKSR